LFEREFRESGRGRDCGAGDSVTILRNGVSMRSNAVILWR
jgi:hypothetical protein